MESILERVILARLALGKDERYVLVPDDLVPIARVLKRALRSSNAQEEVGRAVQLIVVLERQFESPSAAAALMALIRAHPAAIALLRAQFCPGSIDETREIRIGDRPLLVGTPSVRTSSPAPHSR